MGHWVRGAGWETSPYCSHQQYEECLAQTSVENSGLLSSGPGEEKAADADADAITLARSDDGEGQIEAASSSESWSMQVDLGVVGKGYAVRSERYQDWVGRIEVRMGWRTKWGWDNTSLVAAELLVGTSGRFPTLVPCIAGAAFGQ